MRLSGTGLHSGKPCAVVLERTEGPVVFRTARGSVPLEDLRVVRADHGVRVACERVGLDVDGVEHLLAALGGASIRRGLAIRVEGNEVPLLDGAALAFARALDSLELLPSLPVLAVARDETLRVGASTYEFAVGERVLLDVGIDFEETHIGKQRAEWDGDPASFVADIAWARTFGFRRDAERLWAAGRARGVDPASVMVLTSDGSVEPPGAPARPGEFARHKLLDLVGDLFVHGGPPIGTVRVSRPGHAATHRAMTEAIALGVLRKC